MHDVPDQKETQSVTSPHEAPVRWIDPIEGLKDLFLELFGNSDPMVLDLEDDLIVF